MRGFMMVVVAAGFALRGHPRTLSEVSAGDMFGTLLEVMRTNTTQCAVDVHRVLDSLARAYTGVQVPHVLEQVCNSGRFFHAFESGEDCKKMAAELVHEYDEKEPDFVAWCKEVNGMLDTDMTHCECLELPESLLSGPNKTTAIAKDNSTYPSSYGGACVAHDLTLDACSGEFKPAWCLEQWCYVSKECTAKDKKSTFIFDHDLYYSYAACGGLDAFASEACAKQDDATNCTAFSDNCAWNTPSDACQNKLCQCTGASPGLNLTSLGFAENHGQKCGAWDQDKCASYEGTQLGLWCCKNWCYVEESCPSAQKSLVNDGLFFSYLACADDTAALAQCPWQDPVASDGEPLPLSAAAATALEPAAV